MLFGDRKAAWEPGALPDRRVRHWWDGQRIAGRWFARYLGPGGPPQGPGLDVFWDGYLLFGPEAQWEDAPAPLVGAGGTILGQVAELKRLLAPLLAG